MDTYKLLMRHLFDQGWTSGSRADGWGGTFHYQTRHWWNGVRMIAWKLCDDPLYQRNMRDMGYFTYADSYLTQENPVTDCDYLKNSTTQLYNLQFLSGSLSQVHRRLKSYQHWISKALVCGVIEPDGTMHHHLMHHPNYAYGSIAAPINMVSRLARTPFRPEQAAYERLKVMLLGNRFLSNRFDCPPNIQGRSGVLSGHPFDQEMDLFASLARSLPVDSATGPDPELAGLYIAYRGNDAPQSKEFLAAGIKPLELSGHWALNGDCAAIHRNGSRMAAISGLNSLHRGNESYSWHLNGFSRYIDYNSMFILRGGSDNNVADSGYVPDGWNHSMWPAATTCLRPEHEMFFSYLVMTGKKRLGGGMSFFDSPAWDRFHNSAAYGLYGNNFYWADLKYQR